MINLYNYLITEDEFVGSSDKAVYKRLAQHKFNHKTKTEQEKIKKKYPGIPNDTDALVKWFKSANGKLVPNELEIINRKEWNQLGQVGEIENSLMSPHKWSFFEYICKNPRKKKNKILTVLECSNSKPYCQDPAKKWYFSRFRSFTDFACGAYGIVPEEYSQLYPVREDEWAHSDESESVAFKYNLISCNRGYEYIKAMGYEKVIVLFQNPAPEEFLRWMQNMDAEIKRKLVFVNSDQFMSQLKQKYPQLGNGLIVTRFVNLEPVHKRYMKLLKESLSGDDLDRIEELEKLIKNKDKSGVMDWIEKTNETFEIEPYKTDKPGFECQLNKTDIPNHTYTSDLDDKTVNAYKDYLIKWAKSQREKEFDEKTNLHEERLVFTPLDLLIDKYKLNEKNPKKLDIDKLYWNMMKAIEEVKEEIDVDYVDLDKYGRYKYLWAFTRVKKALKKDDLKDYCDKVGVAQFYQNPLER